MWGGIANFKIAMNGTQKIINFKHKLLVFEGGGWGLIGSNGGEPVT